jgi:hypothetical protein
LADAEKVAVDDDIGTPPAKKALPVVVLGLAKVPITERSDGLVALGA